MRDKHAYKSMLNVQMSILNFSKSQHICRNVNMCVQIPIDMSAKYMSKTMYEIASLCSIERIALTSFYSPAGFTMPHRYS